LGELLRHAEAAKENAAKSVAGLTDSLAGERKRRAELEKQLRTLAGERQALTESSARAEAKLEEGRRKLAELESRIQRSARTREDLLIENAPQLDALADRESALTAAQAKAGELQSRSRVAGEARSSENSGALQVHMMAPGEAAAAGSRRAVRTNPKALLRENEILRAKISALVGANDQDDVALRASIERLGQEVSRLYARQGYIDKEASAPRERTSFGQQDAVVIAAPANAETHELDDAPRRRTAASGTFDR